MSTVIDYAWGRPSIAALHAAGAIAVCRYLAYPSQSTQGKLLTAAEAAALTAAGIAVVSNWEQAGSWAEYSGGYSRGRAHAVEADRQHRACGGPPDRPIYFSVDFDATADQLPVVANYYRGVASVIGLDRTGAYGGYRTVKYLLDHGVIRWAWQTRAWSGGLWEPRAHLRQTRLDVPIDGVSCDINESTTADFGQWGVGVTDMEQTDRLVHPSPNAPGRDVGSVLTDAGNLRDWLIGAGQLVPGDASWPKPSSPLARLLALADRPASTVAMTAEDRAAIVASLKAELAPLVPTAAEIAVAVLDEQHRRDAA